MEVLTVKQLNTTSSSLGRLPKHLIDRLHAVTPRLLPNIKQPRVSDMEVSAWYDDSMRNPALTSITEIYYYMVHATSVEERRHWAVEYTKMLCNGKNPS